ncbi:MULTISPECIES: 5-oxoprolinase subunit B family protein [Nocardia]|uniref:Allophanate hydrolase subunit 1 n=1 Tax=Nocardia implantans TaxID=3108168 RepID=A0ABU6ANN3_9NOCA|nr:MULTISPECIES: allophanate hydrolase subunit 1 [unclassified Nocardia]MBF6192001.1 allophanate hydrolase subunit 1 [Nocardia beijingensis]MEA3530131.1 allophanate hydrolase subunit 1 [Nocardia sp. CDC192]MEB3508839.1 allophanate hydrolase subunit 1 [Nocardia sp. CDC186]
MKTTGAVTHAQRRAAEEAIRSAGDRALLVTPHRRDMVAALVIALRERQVPGVQDLLPAAETVLLTLDSPRAAEAVRRSLTTLLVTLDAERSDAVSRGTSSGHRTEPVSIPVRYDGADLDDVARMLEVTTAEVIAAHTGTLWRCAFVGFAPGFGYLEAPDGRLSVPRRAQARTSIPAGAVALAGGYSAVYPRSTPGGWQLIGTTDLRMWDAERDPPALIRAGATVRFLDARDG